MNGGWLALSAIGALALAGATRRGSRARKTLYRAADKPTSFIGAHYGDKRDTAEAYLDNPGFGGTKLYKTHVHMVSPVEVGEGVRRLALAYVRAVDEETRADLVRELEPWHISEGWEYGDPPWEPGDDELAQEQELEWRGGGLLQANTVMENRPEVVEALASEHDWISFADDFPEYATTWRHLSGPLPTLEAIGGW